MAIAPNYPIWLAWLESIEIIPKGHLQNGSVTLLWYFSKVGRGMDLGSKISAAEKKDSQTLNLLFLHEEQGQQKGSYQLVDKRYIYSILHDSIRSMKDNHFLVIKQPVTVCQL